MPTLHFVFLNVAFDILTFAMKVYIINLREKFSPGPGLEPGSNPGTGENFSLKVIIYDLRDGYSES